MQPLSRNEAIMNNRIIHRLHVHYFEVGHEIGTPQAKYIGDTWGYFLKQYKLMHRHTLKKMKTQHADGYINTLVDSFMEMHRLRLKLIQPPESL